MSDLTDAWRRTLRAYRAAYAAHQRAPAGPDWPLTLETWRAAWRELDAAESAMLQDMKENAT